MKEDMFLRQVRKRNGLARLVSVTSRPDVVVHDIAAARWQAEPLTIACLSDFHIMAPWTSLPQVARWVEQVNAMRPDVICLLGDYVAAAPALGLRVSALPIARALARLEAPLGVHAILGNHDWADDPVSRARRGERSAIGDALAAEGLPPLVNAARRIDHRGQDLWLVGLDSQRADPDGTKGRRGRHDAARAFAGVPDDSLAILLAHEPDYFVLGDRRPVLQLSGHTHGGQANFFGWRPFTPSDYAGRYAYGHVEEDGQHLVVSGGLGYTAVPMRIAQPPEITLVRIAGAPKRGPPPCLNNSKKAAGLKT